MIKEIIMPKLGETMEEGVITRWNKKEGDSVNKGEPLLEVMTDKANFEVETPESGVLRKIIAPVSEKQVKVLEIIGYIADSMQAPLPEGKKGVVASPIARKLAAEKGVDLSTVMGTGPGGRIVEKDVLDAAPGEHRGGGSELTGIRKVIAQRMSKSKREIPHYYLQMEIDVTEAAKKKTKEISYNDMIIRAAAKTLQEFPDVNSAFENDRVIPRQSINIGVAVDAKGGLAVPVVKDADKKTLAEVAQATAVIKEKANGSGFTPDDLSGGTFTISNLGGAGVDVFMAIINPPQAAILAVGKIKDTSWVVNGEITIRKIMKVCASFDHRVIDGAEGAKFLYTLKKNLELNYEQL